MEDNELNARNENLPENRRMDFRIGINLGDVIQEEDRIYGDGVNIAARMESNSEPGKINISDATFALIKDHFECKPRGKIAVKGAGEKTMYFVEKQIKQISDRSHKVILSQKNIS